MYITLASIRPVCSSKAHNFLKTFFFFNDTATTEIYTLSLHDALPISRRSSMRVMLRTACTSFAVARSPSRTNDVRSEEHTSELQSRPHLVCRLLLEKKSKSAIGSSCTYG